MTPHRLANWLLAILIAATLGSAYLLDGPTLAESDADTAADVASAQAAARTAARTATKGHPCADDMAHCRPAHKRAALAAQAQAHQPATPTTQLVAAK